MRIRSVADKRIPDRRAPPPVGRESAAPCSSQLGCVPDGGHVDHEAVFYVCLQESVVSFIDFLDRDDFHVRSNVVCTAEVEHLLSLGDAANGRTRETAA